MTLLAEQLSAEWHNTGSCEVSDGTAAGPLSATRQLSVTSLTENRSQPTGTTHSAICDLFNGAAVSQVAQDSYL